MTLKCAAMVCDSCQMFKLKSSYIHGSYLTLLNLIHNVFFDNNHAHLFGMFRIHQQDSFGIEMGVSKRMEKEIM